VDIANPYFANELAAIEETAFTDPTVVEAVDIEAHAAFCREWYCPYVCLAADTLVRAGVIRGLKRAEVAADAQIERTAFSDLHHHGEGSASNIIRLLTHPELLRANFAYSGQSVRNLMEQRGNMAAIRVVGEFHGLADGEIASFDVIDFEALCACLRSIPTQRLRSGVTDRDAADIVKRLCANKGQRFVPPWLSSKDKQLIQKKCLMLANLSAPGEWLAHLISIWLRPMIHAFFVVEGAGFGPIWN
jgi:hypothetical protein